MRLTKVSTPNVPPFDTAELYFDTADNCVKGITEEGLVHVLTRTRNDENILINGGFDFWQRINPNAQTTVSGGAAFGNIADRWVTFAGSGQYNRVDNSLLKEIGLTARSYGRWVGNGSGKRGIGQVVETSVSRTLAGRTVRFQIKLKCPKGTANTATHRVRRLGLLYTVGGTAVDAFPGGRSVVATLYTTTSAAGTDPKWHASIRQVAPVSTEGNGVIRDGAVDCNVPLDVWTRYSATFVVPSDAVNVMPCIWSDYSLALNDELYFSEAGLYIGDEIVDWSPRSIAQELALCQRYYYKTFAPDTAPANAVGINTGEAKFVAMAAGAVAMRTPSFPLPVQMFKTSANSGGVVFNPVSNSGPGFEIRDETGAVDCSLVAIQLRENSLAFTLTGNAATVVGNLLGAHFTVEADF